MDLDLKSADIDINLGRAAKVVVTKENTTIVEGAGDSDQIAARVNQIRAQLKKQLLNLTKRNYKSVLLNLLAA